jgi:hypothetical protein
MKDIMSYFFSTRMVFLVKLLIPISFFYLGVLWSKGYHLFDLILTCLLLLILIIANLFFLYISSLNRREVLLAKSQVDAIMATSRIRIKDWYKYYKMLQDIDSLDEQASERLEKEGGLSVKDSVYELLSAIQSDILKGIRSYTGNIRDLIISITYLQKDKDKDYLYSTVKKRIGTHKMLKGETAEMGKNKFRKGDGSTAAAAWEGKSTEFVADVFDELRKSDIERKFRESSNNDGYTIRSICCVPVWHEDLFFGVLCVSANHKDVFKKHDPFIEHFLSSIRAITTQITLIELVQYVRDEYRVKRRKHANKIMIK